MLRKKQIIEDHNNRVVEVVERIRALIRAELTKRTMAKAAKLERKTEKLERKQRN
jgi:hypothetical protein